MTLTPDDIHIMKKSEYSGMFGDYSSFSDEMEGVLDQPVETEAEDRK